MSHLIITLDPADTLAQASLGPAFAEGIEYGSDEYDAACEEQADLAAEYGALWTEQVRRLVAEAGHTADVYDGRDGGRLDDMGRQPEAQRDLAQQIWQAAHDALGVGVRDGRWAIWA